MKLPRNVRGYSFVMLRARWRLGRYGLALARTTPNAQPVFGRSGVAIIGRAASCPNLAMSDPMPSKMVPAQQLSDAGEDLVRLAAAKDAEIAELRNALAYQDKRWRRATENMLVARRDRDKATEQRDMWKASYDKTCELFHARCAEIATLTEQRDEAMRVVAEARSLLAANARPVPGGRLERALAALDAETAPP